MNSNLRGWVTGCGVGVKVSGMSCHFAWEHWKMGIFFWQRIEYWLNKTELTFKNFWCTKEAPFLETTRPKRWSGLWWDTHILNCHHSHPRVDEVAFSKPLHWKSSDHTHNTPGEGWVGERQLPVKHVHKTPSHYASGYIWLGLLMHKGSSLFGNHTAKKVVRVVVRHSHSKLSPLSPAGGWSSFFKTTSLKKLWPHPQHSNFPVSRLAKEKLHNTTAHCPVACHLLILSNVWHRSPIGA